MHVPSVIVILLSVGALGLRADNESINFNDSGSLKRVSMEDVVVQLINRYGLKVAFVRAPITKEITYQQRIEEIERTPEVQRTRDENTTIEQLSSWIKESLTSGTQWLRRETLRRRYP